MRLVLPDPYVGGPVVDNDPTETFQKRFEGTQQNFEKLALFLNEFAQRFYWGAGSPENVVTAEPGSLYLDTTGGAATTLYIKEANSDDTGWVAK